MMKRLTRTLFGGFMKAQLRERGDEASAVHVRQSEQRLPKVSFGKRLCSLLACAAGGALFLMLPQAAQAAAVDVSCTPDEVIVFTTAPRLHVRCTAPVGNIRYFAISTSDQAQAARVLSVINTTLVAGRNLTIRYDPADLSGASIGCLNADCRLIRAIGFGK